jgi:hypothetical protein
MLSTRLCCRHRCLAEIRLQCGGLGDIDSTIETRIVECAGLNLVQNIVHVAMCGLASWHFITYNNIYQLQQLRRTVGPAGPFTRLATVHCHRWLQGTRAVSTLASFGCQELWLQMFQGCKLSAPACSPLSVALQWLFLQLGRRHQSDACTPLHRPCTAGDGIPNPHRSTSPHRLCDGSITMEVCTIQLAPAVLCC